MIKRYSHIFYWGKDRTPYYDGNADLDEYADGDWCKWEEVEAEIKDRKDTEQKLGQDLWDSLGREEEQKKQIAKLKKSIKLLLSAIPEGWEVPLGYSDIVSQVEQALKAKEK